MSCKLIAAGFLVLALGVRPLPAQTDRGSLVVALFVQDILDYNQRAIELSTIALGRATSRAVLSHARDVIDYATKSNALFRHYASKNGLALRETPESPIVFSATDFEMDYMKTAADGDLRTATLLQGQYDLNFGDFELHQLIGQQLPPLRQHLEAARRVIYFLDVDAQEAPHRVP
jgi:predicted outer membrane protein